MLSGFELENRAILRLPSRLGKYASCFMYASCFIRS